MMLLKKTVYNDLVKKVNTIQTTETSDLVKKTDCNPKVRKIEKKILNHNFDKLLLLKNLISYRKKNLLQG